MTRQKHDGGATSVFHEALQVMDSLEALRRWERCGFQNVAAEERSRALGTKAQLERRLNEALGRVALLPRRIRAKFPIDRAKQLIGNI